MSQKQYGYARISSKDQNAARQLTALQAAGLEKRNIYVEAQSGKNFQRKQYQALMRRLHPGDTLFVKELDRLGRNYEEILENWRIITREKRADIVVLDIPMLDTRRSEGDLTGTFIADLVLNTLSYVAQTERENIRRRQAEGIAEAKARGVRFGNPGKPLPKNFAEIARRWRQKELTLKQALETLGVGRTYFYQHVKELEL